MFEFFFGTEGFPPRWQCGTGWADQPWLGWMHIVADVATGAAYVAIPVLMIIAMRRVRHLPAPRLVALFAMFILACGAVHFIEAMIFWIPVYRLSAAAKVATAVSSCMTAVVFAFAWPRLLEYRSPDELQQEVDRQTEALADAALRLNDTRLLLEQQNDRLAMALDAGKMGTWDVNIDTGELRLDAAEVRLTGLSGETSQDDGSLLTTLEDFYEIVDQDDLRSLQSAVNKAIETGEQYDHEFRIHPRPGETRWVAGRGRLHRRGGERHFVGVNYDITEQKQGELSLQAARQQAEAASEAKSRFLANTSHEIRTPLTAMLGCAESITMSSAEAATVETAQIICRQGKLLMRLLEDVLDLSRIEAGQVEVDRSATCDLHAVLEDVRSMMRPRAVEKSLQFSMEIDNGAPRYISTDPLRLRQILLNLVANAIKYTDRGSVALEVEAAPAGGGNQLSIRVVDTGCGIATDDQQEIFEAFHQVDDKSQNNAHSLNRGVGLGLAIASKLTGLLGGELRVESQPQQGSKFTLHLPAASLGDEVAELAESAAHAAYNPAATYPCRQGRILVAEDTPSIQFLLRKMLSRYATSLDIVGDGQQALEKYCAASADNQPYDLVVLDMNMPVMSGYEFARRLRSDKFATPIIALTASAMIGDRERCLEAGCTSYVAKPIDWSLLEAEVQRSLAEE